MTDQTGPQDNQTDPQTKIDKINDKLDEFASKASGPDVAYGATPGFVEEISEEELQQAAHEDGVTLYRNADGSHEAIDESAVPQKSDSEES
ncbi:MAG TPA: hypothetical protein K8V63_13030 [Brevibacterium linens]|jgi:hypothetical protein|nr:hypothetical protein [Brevibacterium linens]